MEFVSLNPATNQELGRFPEYDPAQVHAILDDVWDTWRAWRRISYADRARKMHRAAEVLRANARQHAEAMTCEMGKPITQAFSEVEKCAWVCDWYADQAETLLAPESVETDATRSMIRFDPLGPVLAVMPWNFPYWQVFRFAAPALMAGNVGLLKHAGNVPHCALLIEEVFHHAGFPHSAFRTLLVGSSRVASIIEDDRIAAVTLTGSEPAGMAVAATAGRCIKKTVLELGGSDPFIVLADADLERAARVAADARLINTGQSCIAAKRFIVESTVYSRFLELFHREMDARILGDPMDPATQVGAMAREDLLEELHDQVKRALEAGAQCILGGTRADREGAFYRPTILTDVLPGNPAFDEELFGPVAAVIRAESAKHAVELANHSRFGLGASLWTRDPALANQLAAEIESGSVFVNGMVKSDPRLPFGGVKKSGFGRELAGYGIKEFVNIKSVWMGE